MKKDDFNIEFFKYIREEIIKRIEIHYKVVLVKFVLTGGLFAFILSKKQEISISAFLIASIFAFLFDIVILENLGWIRSAGYFIKNNIEDIDLKILKWETDFAQCGGSWCCFTVQGYLFGVWIIAPALLLAAFIFDFNTNNKPEVFMFVMSTYLTAYSVYLIFKNLGSNAHFNITKRESPINE